MKHDVLIADDDEHLRDLLQLLLQDYFALQFAENAAQALDLIQQTKFHFMILDIHLPDQSGLDVCRAVNQLPLEQQPPIVIISADTEDLVVKEAYELGVGDYICKPFNVTAFQERMLRLSRDLDKIAALQKQDENAYSMTATVMKQAASYGNGLELIARLNSCHNPQSLCKSVLQNFQGQGFHCAIQARTPNETLSFDIDVKDCSDIELQVFELLKNKGRIYNFGKRCIFNDEHVSILVKNMPSEGTASYDSMLDVAAKVVPAINARFVSICEHKYLVEAKNSLTNAISMLSEGVTEMEAEKRQMMENIEMQIGLSFHQLDMDEKQETFFLNMIEREIRSREESSKLDKLQCMITDCVNSINIMEHDDEEEESAETSNTGEDVELF